MELFKLQHTRLKEVGEAPPRVHELIMAESVLLKKLLNCFSLSYCLIFLAELIPGQRSPRDFSFEVNVPHQGDDALAVAEKR